MTNENETPTTPKPPQMVDVAILDAEEVYQGIEQIAEDQVTDMHVLLPHGCDLPIGKYFFDRTRGAFMPLASPQQRAEESPVALNALAWMLLNQHSSGASLPSPCLRWLDFYIRTIDFGIPDDDGAMTMVANYRAGRGIK